MLALEMVQSLIDSAKRLRSIADELGNVEIKARILDDLVALQEYREQMMSSSDVGAPPAAQHSPPPLRDPNPSSESRKLLPQGNASQYARLDAATDIETYTLAFATEEPAPPPVPAPSAETPKDAAGTKTTPAAAVATPPTDAEKFALAEQKIAELEPLHQAILKKMNDVLTPEQQTAKLAATKKGRTAKLTGKALQDAVVAALQLTDAQQQRLAQAKHELHQVRLAISKQVEGLLSKEQLEEMLRTHRH